ncbi:MAG: hypothetical protein HYT75_02380 [Deltaproteobacteria bacterium]|nr:hypothetical protein [Deltaproteobacteria bacterium]
MPVYAYSGINDKGKKVAGSVDAENEKAARLKLRKMSVFPTSLVLGGTAASAKIGLSSNIDFSKMFVRIKLKSSARFFPKSARKWLKALNFRNRCANIRKYLTTCI